MSEIPLPASAADTQAAPPAPEAALRDEVYYFDVVIFKVRSILDSFSHFPLSFIVIFPFLFLLLSLPFPLGVEDTLFRVPKRRFIAPGSYFESKFSPRPLVLTASSNEPKPEEDEEEEGTTDANPIVLHDISKHSFRAFLRVLYPFDDLTVLSFLRYEDWTGVLELSALWGFELIKARAIAALTPMLETRPVPQILLGKKYKIPAWIKRGFMRLTSQETPPDIGALLEQGMDPISVAKLFSAREKIHMEFSKRHKRLSDVAVVNSSLTIPIDTASAGATPASTGDSPLLCNFCGKSFSQEAGDSDAASSLALTPASFSFAPPPGAGNAHDTSSNAQPSRLPSGFVPIAQASRSTPSGSITPTASTGSSNANTTATATLNRRTRRLRNTTTPSSPKTKKEPAVVSLPPACSRGVCQDKRKIADGYLKRVGPAYTAVADESAEVIDAIFADELK